MVDKALPFKVGQRTELVALVIAVLAGLQAIGLISPEHFTRALEILGPIGVATLAAKLDRLLKPIGLATTPMSVVTVEMPSEPSMPPPAPSQP